MEFKLRRWSMDDLDSVCKYGGNPNITKNMSDGFPENRDKWRSFIEFAITKDKTILYRAIEIKGEAVGGIGVSVQKDYMRKNAELGYWLGEDFWGLGIITRAIIEIVQLSFNKFDINRIFATPFETNYASHRVLEKTGFKLEARFKKIVVKNGEVLDLLVYAIRRDE